MRWLSWILPLLLILLICTSAQAAIDNDGVTDRTDYTNIGNFKAGVACSAALWVYVTDHDLEAAQYWIASHVSGDGGVGGFIIFDQDANNTWQLSLLTDVGATQVARTTTTGIASGGWHHIGVSYDGGTVGSGILLYSDGADDSGSTADSAAAAFESDGSYSIGGRIHDDARNAEARFADIGFWNRVVTAAEFAALADGFPPTTFPNGLVWAPALIREINDPITGQAGTADGTTVIEHDFGRIYN